jgi:microcompartment protein CcmL/EutN
MENLVQYLNCGLYRSVSDQDWGNYVVKRISDNTDNLIPFFNKYQIEGEKVKDFEGFKQAAEIMETKSHLTKEGLFKINQIKAEMNKGRSTKLT